MLDFESRQVSHETNFESNLFHVSVMQNVSSFFFCKYSHQPFIFPSEIFIETYMNLEESKSGKGRFAQWNLFWWFKSSGGLKDVCAQQSPRGCLDIPGDGQVAETG